MSRYFDFERGDEVKVTSNDGTLQAIGTVVWRSPTADEDRTRGFTEDEIVTSGIVRMMLHVSCAEGFQTLQIHDSHLTRGILTVEKIGADPDVTIVTLRIAHSPKVTDGIDLALAEWLDGRGARPFDDYDIVEVREGD